MRAAFVEGEMEDATRLLVMTRISRQPLVLLIRKPIRSVPGEKRRPDVFDLRYLPVPLRRTLMKIPAMLIR